MSVSTALYFGLLVFFLWNRYVYSGRILEKVGKEWKIHHLRTNILASEHPPHSGFQRRRRQWRTPATRRDTDLARCEKKREDQLPIWKINKHTLSLTSRDRYKDQHRCRSRVETYLFAWTLLLPSQQRIIYNRQTLTARPEQRNEVPLPPTAEAASGGRGTNANAGEDVRICVAAACRLCESRWENVGSCQLSYGR
jgi:hypothetical protein